MKMSENIPSNTSDVILRKSEKENEIAEVPDFISTPNKSKSTLSTSFESSPSWDLPTPKEIVHLSMQQEQSDEDSTESDISGLTSYLSSLSMKQISVPFQNNNERRIKPLPYPETSFQRMQEIALGPPRRRGVRFSTVCVREYERILGDNPSCTSGPSVGIGWHHIQEELLSVDEWESWRETERQPDRLVLCREEREDMLLDLGYTEKDIAAAVRQNVKSKNKRRQTIQNLRASGLEEAAESAKKRVMGLLKLGKKKKKEIFPVQSDNQKLTSLGTNIANHEEPLTCTFDNKYRSMEGEEDPGSYLDGVARMQSEPRNVASVPGDDVRIMPRNSLTMYRGDNRRVPRNTMTTRRDSISSGIQNFARIPIEVSLTSRDEALDDKVSRGSDETDFVNMRQLDEDGTVVDVESEYNA
jgi:hypothetical protein